MIKNRPSTCPCYQNLENVLTATFVIYDEEEKGYIRYLSFNETCRLCGRVVHSYGDVDWEATEEDYRIYLEKREQYEGHNIVICTYCWEGFASKSLLDKHIESSHADSLKEGSK